MRNCKRSSVKTGTSFALPYNKQSKSSPGRTQGFSRLINEKTVLAETSELDVVIQQLGVALPSKEVETRFHDDAIYALKFVSEAISRRRQNEFHLLFEEPLLASHIHDLIFPSRHLQIYLTLKRPPSLKGVNVPGGYPNIQVHAPPKAEDETMDTFEFIRSTKPKQKRYLCPKKTVRCVFQLLQAAVSEMKRRYRDMLKITSLSLHESMNGIECSFHCKRDYLIYHMSDLRAKTKVDPEVVQNTEEKKDDDEEREEEEVVESDEESREKPAIMPEEEDPMQPSASDSDKLNLVMDKSVKERSIQLLIYPGFCMHTKDKVYFLGKPYGWGDLHAVSEESIVWRMYYTQKENTLLDYIFRADGHVRHTAWRIISDLCCLEEELRPLQPEHIKQVILLCLEQQVDEATRWQRKTIASCMRDLFYMLRDSLHNKMLHHYFIEGMNILQSLTDVERSRAMVRCSVFAKSENVLCNTLKRVLALKTKEAAKLAISQIREECEEDDVDELFSEDRSHQAHSDALQNSQATNT